MAIQSIYPTGACGSKVGLEEKLWDNIIQNLEDDSIFVQAPEVPGFYIGPRLETIEFVQFYESIGALKGPLSFYKPLSPDEQKNIESELNMQAPAEFILYVPETSMHKFSYRAISTVEQYRNTVAELTDGSNRPIYAMKKVDIRQ